MTFVQEMQQDFSALRAQDHDDFGLNQSRIMNVIDSKSFERAAGEKPASTFSHPALGPIEEARTEDGIIIGCEQPGDAPRREALLDAAFGRKERFAKTCQRIREGRLPAHGLSLAARKNGEFVGTLRMWHVDAGGVPALLLGPLAVSRTQRSQGIGGLLMNEALARAADLGHLAVILVGDASFYAPFGFTRAHTRSLAMPGPIDEARFLGLELQEGAFEKAHGLVAPTGALDLRAHRPRASRAVSRAA